VYGLGVGISIVFQNVPPCPVPERWGWPQGPLPVTLGIRIRMIYVFGSQEFLGYSTNFRWRCLMYILPLTLGIYFWSSHVNTFDGYIKKFWNWILLHPLQVTSNFPSWLEKCWPTNPYPTEHLLSTTTISYERLRKCELGRKDGQAQRWQYDPPPQKKKKPNISNYAC
jgi:hypothetical protein